MEGWRVGGLEGNEAEGNGGSRYVVAEDWRLKTGWRLETGGQAEDEDSFAMEGGPLGFVSAPRRRSLNRAPLKALKSPRANPSVLRRGRVGHAGDADYGALNCHWPPSPWPALDHDNFGTRARVRSGKDSCESVPMQQRHPQRHWGNGVSEVRREESVVTGST